MCSFNMIQRCAVLYFIESLAADNGNSRKQNYLHFCMRVKAYITNTKTVFTFILTLFKYLPFFTKTIKYSNIQ
jgi:hypothetical protein